MYEVKSTVKILEADGERNLDGEKGKKGREAVGT